MNNLDEKNYLWQHFVFNAEQRLKAFNFFVVFSVFANGGVFAAIEKGLPAYVFVLMGGFVAVLAVIFWIIDTRSKVLIQLAVPGLLEYEKQFDARSRLFANDAASLERWVSYTIAFRALFVLQFLFGVGVAIAGARTWENFSQM